MHEYESNISAYLNRTKKVETKSGSVTSDIYCCCYYYDSLYIYTILFVFLPVIVVFFV